MTVDVQCCVQRAVKAEVVTKLRRCCGGVEIGLCGKQKRRSRSSKLVQDLESSSVEHDAELSAIAD